ncbi:MAG: DUF937 domain-containing protein [Lachnospiraceae bacterium]|nr:DUF937 domain-containing protein [Lachnospiraceae bacterium]
MNLLSMLLGSMGSQSSVNSLSQQTGVGAGKLKKLLPLLIPILLRYLTKNASNKEGAQSLLGALTQHTSKETVAAQIDEVDQKDGELIIKHILGDDTEKVVNELAKESDMENEEVEKSLFSIAPSLLSILSSTTENAASAQNNNGPDFGSLLSLFGGAQEEEVQQVEEAPAAPNLGLLSSLFGGGAQQQAQPEPQPQQQSGGGIFSLFTNLFGGGMQQQAQQQEPELLQLDGAAAEEEAANFDGSNLLGTLLQMMQ